MFRFFYQHNNSIYCGNGSETFRFLLPIVCMEVRCFASFTNITIVYIVGMEAKHFASCCPFSLCGSEMFRFFYQTQQLYVLWEWKRNISLLVAHWSLEASCFASCTSTQQYSMVYIVGMEAKYFASCCPLTVWKRDVSLLVTHWLLQAKCFAFPDTI